MFDKRLNIFTGHFGSGKTEVAVNFALQLSEKYNRVAIVDFDIVNPFFRTADVKGKLEDKGIYVVTPVYANTNIDAPALPSQITSVFEDKGYRAVFDVGGDDLGAKVLSRYREDLLRDDYEMYFVINTRRPETNTPEKIKEMIREIEGSSRLKVSSLVNNTNLLNETTSELVENGHEIISRVSKDLNIPIGFISGLSKNLIGLDGVPKMEILYKLIKLPWD